VIVWPGANNPNLSPSTTHHPKEMEDYTLHCRLDIPGEIGFSVTIPPTQDVYDLKKAIILELPVDYENTKATDLKLYRVGGNKEPLSHKSILSDVFGPTGPLT
jgi:hypothetical protein